MGTAFAGFQRQPSKRTVQATLEDAIRIVTQEDVRLVAAGRTDAGTHALQQVAAFSTASTLPVADMTRALNATLPFDVAVTSIADVDPSFHPRFDAVSRIYRYVIWNRTIRSPLWHGRAAHIKRILDADAMNEAAAHLIGRHDFSAFIPQRIDVRRTRVLYNAHCRRDGDLVIVELEAQGFMRQMIRSIVGSLVEIGLGKADPDSLRATVESRDRREGGDTMPACGLYLVEVRYDAPRLATDLPGAPRHTGAVSIDRPDVS